MGKKATYCDVYALSFGERGNSTGGRVGLGLTNGLCWNTIFILPRLRSRKSRVPFRCGDCGDGKGTAAEGFVWCQAGISWGRAKYARNCHRKMECCRDEREVCPVRILHGVFVLRNVILGPLCEGAVSEADWGSVLNLWHHAIHPTTLPPALRATSLKEGGKAASRLHLISQLSLTASPQGEAFG